MTRIEALLGRSLVFSRDKFFSLFTHLLHFFTNVKLIAIDSFIMKFLYIVTYANLVTHADFVPARGTTVHRLVLFFLEFCTRLSQPTVFDGLLKEFARRLTYPCIQICTRSPFRQIKARTRVITLIMLDQTSFFFPLLLLFLLPPILSHLSYTIPFVLHKSSVVYACNSKWLRSKESFFLFGFPPAFNFTRDTRTYTS